MMIPEPRVSIGLPVYNGERFLPATIDSLLAQTFTDFELMISDDASTDGTGSICREYARRDSRVGYYRATANAGAAVNFNRLVGYARGQYFKWAAQTDLCAATYLQRCVESLDRDASVVLAHARAVIIDKRGRRLPTCESRLTPFDPADDWHPRSALYDAEMRRLDAAHASVRLRDLLIHTHHGLERFGLIRRAALQRAALRSHVDKPAKVMLAHLGLIGRFVAAPEELFFRRSLHERPEGDRPSRFGSAVSVARAIFREPIAAGERVKCLLAAAEYGLGVDAMEKWIFHAEPPMQELLPVGV